MRKHLVNIAVAVMACIPGVGALQSIEPSPQDDAVPVPEVTPEVDPVPSVNGALDGYEVSHVTYRLGTTVTTGTPLQLFEYKRLPLALCMTSGPIETAVLCVGDESGTWIAEVCEDGSEGLRPLFRRTIGAPAAQWEQVDDGGCPGAPGLVVVSAEEFRRLPLTASTPRFQPPDGRGLVNKDLIVYADPAPQTLATTVLGVPVTVRATPVRFAWDFGDGSDPLVTTDPGAPYPDHTVSYPYRQPGQFAVQLVTAWQGQYQVNGAGSWYPVAGTATTSSAPFTAQVFEAHAHLVADDLG